MSQKNRKNNNQNKRNIKLFLSIFMPYFLLVILMGGMGSLLCIRAMKTLERDAVRNGEEKAAHISSQIALEVYDNLPILASLENSSRVKEIADYYRTKDPSYAMTSYYFQKEMLAKLDNANYLAAYLPEQQFLITTNNGYDADTLPIFLESNGITQEMLDSILEKKYRTLYINPQHSWITSQNTLSDGTKVLMIADYQLLNVIKSVVKEEEYFALASRETMFYASEDDFADLGYETIFENNGRIVKINGEECVLVRTELNMDDLVISIGIPLGAISGEIIQFRRMLSWVLPLLLIGSVVFSIQRSGKLYRPINELEQLSEGEGDSSTAFATIKNAGKHIANLNQTNYRMRREMEEVTPVLLGKKCRLLTENSESERSARSAEIYNILGFEQDEPAAFFGIGILSDDGNLFADSEQETRFGKNGMKYFFLNNFLQDLVFEKHKGILANLGDYYILIAKGDGDIEEFSKAAKDLEEVAAQYMQLNVATTPVHFADNQEKFAEELVKANAECLKLLFVGQEELPETSENETASYAETMKMLINCLTAKEYSKAEQIMDGLVTMQLPGDEEDIRKPLFRMYGTIGIIISVFESQTGSDWKDAGTLDYGRRLYKVKNIREFKKESKKILSELIRYREEYQKNAIPDIVVQAKDYIDSHFCESGLNVSAVAEALNVSDSYLTKMFRTYMEYNVLEYIQRKRVEKAKELMRTESVKDTALQIGLWDTQALIRLFKKYEGITPGAYKEQIVGSESDAE